MTINNGDLPAMPITGEPYPTGAIPKNSCEGLTKREMFAMAAMQGVLANTTMTPDLKRMAERAVFMADALLAELERTK